MEIYLVGGAVRDQLLGVPVYDHDWVVVGATAEEMLAKGFQPVGKDFPVFLHPESKEEYALARTERKNGHGYKGFEFFASPDVTLEEDLRRRDLTINAMAMDSDGQLFDPFNGQRDLEQRILRHVSEAFVEDPLRVLRVARFNARFHHLGFQLAPETLALMQQLAEQGELQHLTAERVWQEFDRALGEVTPEIFFTVLNQAQALPILMPEVAAHYDQQCNSANQLLRQCAQAKASTELRLGLYCYALGLTPAETESLLERLKAPKLAQRCAQLIVSQLDNLLSWSSLKPVDKLESFKRLDIQRRPEQGQWLLDALQMLGETATVQKLDTLWRALAEIQPQEIVAAGFSGKAIGTEIDRRRTEIIEQEI